MDIKWIYGDSDKYMKLHRKDDVLWLSVRSLDRFSWLQNAFATRFGGVSTGHFASMNLSFEHGDSPDCVRENIRRICGAIGISSDQLVCTMQTHTTNVRRVSRRDCGRALEETPAFTDVDGLITNEPGVALMIFFADCVPLFFVDPVHRAIGASHSGWRGTAGKMARVTIEAMKREFGSDPEHMLAAIGPSICKNCYTVNGDVAKRFDERFYEEGTGTDQYQLDLQAANRALMIEAGIPAESISMPDLCTGCNPDLLFSHRASKGKRGTMAAFLSLTNKS